MLTAACMTEQLRAYQNSSVYGYSYSLVQRTRPDPLISNSTAYPSAQPETPINPVSITVTNCGTGIIFSK